MPSKVKDDAKKRRLVREWDRSGLSAERFGLPLGIHPATLQSWGRAIRGPLRKRAKIHSAHDLNVELVEVVAENEEEPERAPRIEVELKNGRRLILFSVWEPKMLAELAQVLEGGENT